MTSKTIEIPEHAEFGQPEAGATLFDAVTGEPAGTIKSVNEAGLWQLPVDLKPGRYRVMIPYEFDIPDWDAFGQAIAGAEIPRVRMK